MNIVVINLDSQPERMFTMAEHLDDLGLDYERFPAYNKIPITYMHLAEKAYNEKWDENTIVVQDDIRFTETPYVVPGLIAVYSPVTVGRRGLPHVCPQAFAASEESWEKLDYLWPGWGGVCNGWRGYVLKHAVFLDIAIHIGDPSGEI